MKITNVIRDAFSALSDSQMSPIEQCGVACAMLHACKNGGLTVEGDKICSFLNTDSAASTASLQMIEKLDSLRHDSLVSFVQSIKTLHTEIANGILSYAEAIQAIVDGSSSSAVTPPHILPKEVLDLCTSLIDNAPEKVLCPFDDFAQFARRNPMSKSVVLLTEDKQTSLFATIALALINSGQTKVSALPISAPKSWAENNYNAILPIPAFGAKGIVPNDRTPSEVLPLKHFCDLSADNGQLVTVVPASVLLRETERELRQALTSRNMLDKIILLPGGLLSHTGIGTAIVVLKKQRRPGEPIALVDASQMCEKDRRQNILDLQQVRDAIGGECENKTLVSPTDIESRDWTWNVCEYLAATQHTPIADGVQATIFKMSDILSPISPNTNSTNLPGRVVSPSELSTDAFRITIDVASLPQCTQDMDKLSKLEEPAFLVSKLASSNGKLRVAFCNATSTTPVFYKRMSICAYRVSSVVNVDFLALQLQNSNISHLFGGTAIPMINHGAFERFEIAVPPLSAQTLIYNTARDQYLVSRAKEQGLTDIINRMKKEYIQEISLRKHEMMQYIEQIAANKYVMQHILAKMPHDTNVTKLIDKVQSISNALTNLSQKLTTLSREETHGTPEDIKLREFANDFCNKYAKSNFDTEVSFDTSCDEVLINITKEDLQSIFQNIFNNAERHGFTDKSRTDYKILIKIRLANGYVSICFANNGNPLPSGLTTERYALRGEKAGANGNEGQGGAHIQTIVNHYNGKLEVGNTSGHVEINIKLPISQNQYNAIQL